MPVTDFDFGCWYSIEGGELALPHQEINKDGIAWIEATVTTSAGDCLKQYPKAEFLSMLRDRIAVGSYRDHE